MDNYCCNRNKSHILNENLKSTISETPVGEITEPLWENDFQKIEAFQERLDAHWLSGDERLKTLYEEYEAKMKV